jgi:hypothetical protein
MKYIIRIILMTALIAFGGCARIDGEGYAAHTTSEMVNMLKKPVTPLDMLNNVKFALDNHLLIKEEFYSDENLTHFFNGKKINWITRKPAWLFGSVLGLDHLVESDENKWCIEMSVNFDTVDKNGEPSIGGKLQGSGGLQMVHDNQLTAELVQSVFGVPTEIVTPNQNYSYKSDFISQGPPTHELGNKVLKYEFSNEKENWVTLFTLRPNGTVNRFNFYDVEK